MPKLSILIGLNSSPDGVTGGASSAEVTALKEKIAALEAQVKAIPETIVVSSVDDLPDPTQLKSGAAARVLSNGTQYLATGVKDNPATGWES